MENQKYAFPLTIDQKKYIDGLSRLEMCRLYRFSPAGFYLFDKQYEACDYFLKRYQKLGGMSPEISKEIGW